MVLESRSSNVVPNQKVKIGELEKLVTSQDGKPIPLGWRMGGYPNVLRLDEPLVGEDFK